MGQPRPPKPILTLESLKQEARAFAALETIHPEPTIFGVTDGKAIGTYLEHKFQAHLEARYVHAPGNSAVGIDMPGLNVDIKVTSSNKPQSSSPFRDVRQKIFGLGYHLLIFVYEKSDDHQRRTATLSIRHTLFVEKSRTGDYQTTRGLLEIVKRKGSEEDLAAFLLKKKLTQNDFEARTLALEVLKTPPTEGYLTLSSVPQWRHGYPKRMISKAGTIAGLEKLR